MLCVECSLWFVYVRYVIVIKTLVINESKFFSLLRYSDRFDLFLLIIYINNTSGLSLKRGIHTAFVFLVEEDLRHGNFVGFKCKQHGYVVPAFCYKSLCSLNIQTIPLKNIKKTC